MYIVPGSVVTLHDALFMKVQEEAFEHEKDETDCSSFYAAMQAHYYLF